MEYVEELLAIQTWVKSVAGLNSYRLKDAKPKVARPVILWEVPSRVKDRNLSRYTYVQKVRQYGRLFVNSLDEVLDVQEKLSADLESVGNVLPVYNAGVFAGYLKAVTLEFTEGVDLDVKFNVAYEVAHGNTRPQEAPPATKVINKIVATY
jgi:hypothetical protein